MVSQEQLPQYLQDSPPLERFERCRFLEPVKGKQIGLGRGNGHGQRYPSLKSRIVAGGTKTFGNATGENPNHPGNVRTN